MQERAFKFLFKRGDQTELKQFLVEMQLSVDLTNYHSSAPVSNFRGVSKKGSSTFLCFSLPCSGKESKATRLRGFIKEKITGSCHGIAITSKLRYPCQTMCLLVLLLDYILPYGQQRELSSVGKMNRKMKPRVLQRWMCHIKSSFQAQVRINWKVT